MFVSSPELGPGDSLVTLSILKELTWGPVGSKALWKAACGGVERRRLCARTAAQGAPSVS